LQHGFTPLHLAVDNNHTQLAKLLLDKGATPDAADTVSSRQLLRRNSCRASMQHFSSSTDAP
jgi:ankyrin repeat protein